MSDDEMEQIEKLKNLVMRNYPLRKIQEALEGIDVLATFNEKSISALTEIADMTTGQVSIQALRAIKDIREKQ